MFSKLTHDDRPRQPGPQIGVVEAHVAIGEMTQPGDDPPGPVNRCEQPVAVVAGAGSLDETGTHHPPIPFQQHHGSPLPLLKVVNVHRRDLLDKGSGPAPVDLDQPVSFFPLTRPWYQTVMGIAAARDIKINPRSLGQVGHLEAQILQRVKLDLALVGRPAHAGVGDRLGGPHRAGDDAGDLFHLRLPQTTLSYPGGTQPDAAGVRGRPVARDGVLVDHDAHYVEDRRRDVAHQRRTVAPCYRLAVEEQQVCVGAAARDAQALCGERPGERHCIGHGLMLESVELFRLRQAEGDGHRSELVDVRAALKTGKDSVVNLSRQDRVGGEDAGPSRPAERLVGGKGDDVGVTQRRGKRPGDDHTGHVSNVGQKIGPHPVGDLAELGPVGQARVRGVTGNDQFGPVLQRQFLHLVIVEQLCLWIDVIRDGVIEPARQVDRAAVSQVTAMSQRHAHDRVARL